MTRRRAAVATSHPLATQTAADLLRAGGSAADAAVAAALTLAVCEPSGSGLGGIGAATVRTAEGPVMGVTGDARAPLAVPPGSRLGRDPGARAAAVPTAAAVLATLHRRWGRRPWRDVVAPASVTAWDGFVPLREERRRWRRAAPRLARDAVAAACYLPSGRAPRAREVVRLPLLGQTLERIAAEGAEDLYLGRLARGVVADQAARGGWLAAEDLAAGWLRVRTTTALSADVGRHELVTLPTAGGAVLLGSVLLARRLAERDAAGGRAARPVRVLAAARAVRAVHELRDVVALDDDPLAAVDDEVLEALALRASPDGRAWDDHDAGPEVGGDTTHVSVADADGLVVSLTTSLQSSFGSHTACAATGFLWNDYLTTCTRRPGPHALGPCARPRSNAAPVAVLSASGQCRAALGSAGGRRITSSLAHVLGDLLHDDADLETAITGPRAHLLASGRLWVEDAELAQARPGHAGPVVVLGHPDRRLGVVNAVGVGPDGAHAAADPRREGATAAVVTVAPEVPA